MRVNGDFLGSLEDYLRMKRYRLVKSVLAYQNGLPVFEGYYNGGGPDRARQIKSVWKSILSMVLGICLDQGRVGSLDEFICRYLPLFGERIQPFHHAITIRHLLTMSSGLYWNGGVHYHCPMLAQMLGSRN